MAIFKCPQCFNDFDTDDKDSNHQVNDVLDETYCSLECSENAFINPVNKKYLVHGLTCGLFDKSDILAETTSELVLNYIGTLVES